MEKSVTQSVSPLDQYRASGQILISCDQTACDTEFVKYYSIYKEITICSMSTSHEMRKKTI